MSENDPGYGISSSHAEKKIPPPEVDYLPRRPHWRPKIGLIGAGGITEHHLEAYRTLELDVAAISNRTVEKAIARRDQFYPGALVTSDFNELLANEEIEVVDIALPPRPRIPAIEAAIAAGKHVLSQKPFVEDIETGRRLCDMADKAGVKLAINQNGRWAPHYRWALEAVRNGHLGRISSVDFCQQWDHTWTAATPFNEIHHLLLYDFGIHWFDFASAFAGDRELLNVFASVQHADYQTVKPPFLAHAVLDFAGFQARILFNAHLAHGQRDSFTICGEKGVIRSHGIWLRSHEETAMTTDEGKAFAQLEGEWTTNGFQGTMCELLNAVAENRAPENSARNNLRSLELCFKAVECASELEKRTG